MTSFLENIPQIVRAAVSINPTRILDIGAGFGKFGLLLKEALLSEQAEAGELYPVPKFKIDACESADYFLDHLSYMRIYDRLLQKDARVITDVINNGHYDLILLIDVIEHWDKKDFLEFTEKISGETKLLISTPKEVVFYEPKYYGIDKHITQYSDFDFKGGENFSTKDSLIYLI